MIDFHRSVLVILGIEILALAANPTASRGFDGELPPDVRQRLEQRLGQASGRLTRLEQSVGPLAGSARDRFADARIFAKGLAWALEYETTFADADRELLERAIERFETRVSALEARRNPWVDRNGKLARGFVSSVDGSTQPYGLIIPANFDTSRKWRLDVVLHGSTKPVGISELRFISRFDEGDAQSRSAPDTNWIELHPLGRVENGYRWAGETDVFEAIEAVCRNYPIDRDRIVLRGMSMGASGTWHLGLKHPDRFVALGPYCGYVDTHEFSRTPLPNFVIVGDLPARQEKMLHLLDSVDYAANARMVPAIACMGEKDVFFQAHEIMRRAMSREGVEMVNLISPGTGHVIDPVTHREQLRRIESIASRGLDHAPREVRFVTWSLRYSRCHWIQVLGLGEHYDRAEIHATWSEGGGVVVDEPRNITRFAILEPVAEKVRELRVGGTRVDLPDAASGVSRSLVLEREGTRWVTRGALESRRWTGKRPGLQGPIDDAFTAPFLCVRGTGTAWNPRVSAWANASLDRFRHEWKRYFRGDPPLLNDVDVTEADAQRHHLILFGDPGSNSWIGRVADRLPLRWTRDEIELGGQRARASNHAPILIHPNPLAPDRYVVINSGHTFHEAELSTLNYLLFPRLGDWAVVEVSDSPREPLGRGPREQLLESGFFDEQWGLRPGNAAGTNP